MPQRLSQSSSTEAMIAALGRGFRNNPATVNAIKLFLKACESSKNRRIRCVISATGEAFLVE
jgi:hypothetical protein